jgi:hypothetical protein
MEANGSLEVHHYTLCKIVQVLNSIVDDFNQESLKADIHSGTKTLSELIALKKLNSPQSFLLFISHQSLHVTTDMLKSLKERNIKYSFVLLIIRRSLTR